MAQSKAAPKTKAAAARTEKRKGKAKPKAKSLMWRGTELELPAEFPEKLMTQFQVDVVLAEETGQETQLPAYRMLITMIGAGQLSQIRGKLEREEDVANLLEEIFQKYGLSLGESQASQAS